MKSSLIPWILAGGGVAGLLYLAFTYENAKNLPPAKQSPAPPPGPVPILGPGAVTTPAPGQVGVPAPKPKVPGQVGVPARKPAVLPTPAPVQATGLAPEVATTIATLLDSRVKADPALLNAYAKIAGGADGKQNPAIVARLDAKAYITAIAQQARPQGAHT